MSKREKPRAPGGSGARGQHKASRASERQQYAMSSIAPQDCGGPNRTAALPAIVGAGLCDRVTRTSAPIFWCGWRAAAQGPERPANDFTDWLPPESRRMAETGWAAWHCAATPDDPYGRCVLLRCHDGYAWCHPASGVVMRERFTTREAADAWAIANGIDHPDSMFHRRGAA